MRVTILDLWGKLFLYEIYKSQYQTEISLVVRYFYTSWNTMCTVALSVMGNFTDNGNRSKNCMKNSKGLAKDSETSLTDNT